MKIAVGMNLQKGAFGGGNQFGKALTKFLNSKDIKVAFDLKDRDIDLILLTETRKWLASCAFDVSDVAKYLGRKPDTLAVFRINECDERKGKKIKSLNRLIVKSAKFCDRIVFISGWLENLFLRKKKELKDKSMVIYNGADTDIFNPKGYQKWNREGPLKIVAHHWAANRFKGFDIYLKLDDLIGKRYGGKVEFTFIGNIPKKVEFKNTTIISPKSGTELAKEIKQNHIYLTASINEPAGMHHIEGALCGLPILYRNSGALPEYCKGYGLSFEGQADFQERLEQMMEKYDYFTDKVRHYGNTSEKMCGHYFKLFINLINSREEIIGKRAINRFDLYEIAILKKALRIKEGLKI